MYSFVRSFITLSVVNAAIGVLIVAYVVEIAQHFRFVNPLGLQDSKSANIVFGNALTHISIH